MNLTSINITNFRCFKAYHLNFAPSTTILIGRNGAGKTMFVDMLTGKFLLREGTLEYDFRPAPTNYAYKNIKYIIKCSKGDSYNEKEL